MSRFALMALAAGLCLIFWLITSRPALIRGVAEGMLVSPHRPGVAVRPAPEFSLRDARRASPAVAVEHQSMPSGADVWYALFETADRPSPARMVALFAQAKPRYEWSYDDPRPTGVSVLKHTLSRHGDTEGGVMLYTMTPDQDPWHTGSDEAPWTNGSLVCRWRFHIPLWRFVIMVEYREPLPASALPPDADPAALAAFELRASNAFTLLKTNKDQSLPAPSAKLPYPPQELCRTKLGKALGPVRSITQH